MIPPIITWLFVIQEIGDGEIGVEFKGGFIDGIELLSRRGDVVSCGGNERLIKRRWSERPGRFNPAPTRPSLIGTPLLIGGGRQPPYVVTNAKNSTFKMFCGYVNNCYLLTRVIIY